MHTRSAVKIWGTWTAVVISTLVGMETYALKTRRIPPATTFLKLCCGVEPVKPWRHLGVTVFAGFFGWLVLHVCFDLGPHLKQRGGTP